jgi:hypothetical protein
MFEEDIWRQLYPPNILRQPTALTSPTPPGSAAQDRGAESNYLDFLGDAARSGINADFSDLAGWG